MDNTAIRYRVTERSHIQIALYNLQGRLINMLVDREQAPGKYVLDFYDASIPPGMYYFALLIQSNDSFKSLSRKLVCN